MTEYETRDYNNATKLATALGALSPNDFSLRTVEDPDNQGQTLILLDAFARTYRVLKDYNNALAISEYPRRHYPTVSSTKERDARTSIFTSNRIITPTASKIMARLREVDTYNLELERQETANLKTHADFLASFDLQTSSATDPSPVAVTYSRKEWHDPSLPIVSGSAERHGIVYTFTFGQDGYISHKVELSYKVRSSIASFLDLSANKYSDRRCTECGDPLDRSDDLYHGWHNLEK